MGKFILIVCNGLRVEGLDRILGVGGVFLVGNQAERRSGC